MDVIERGYYSGAREVISSRGPLLASSSRMAVNHIFIPPEKKLIPDECFTIQLNLIK